MNEDAMIITVMVAFPIVVGSMGILFILGLRRATSTQCPHCSRRIPKAVITLSLRCPHCDRIAGDATAGSKALSPVARIAEPLANTQRCKFCDKAVERRPCVRLWDGEVYCIDCVNAHDPNLFTCAQTNAKLEETMPHSAWRVAGADGGRITSRM